MALDKLDIAMLEDVGTGANQLVQLDSNAKLPAVDASNLINITASALIGSLPAGDASAFTNLTAANINGTIPDASFPAILPARNAQALTNLNAANLTGTINSSITYAGDGGPLTNLTSANLVGALPALDAGNLTNLTAANLVGSVPLSNLVVKQVKTYTKANAFSTSSDTFVDVTDMEISITTIAVNSRLFVFGHLACSATSNYSWGGWHMRLTRDGTVMTVGTDTTSGNDEQGAMGGLTRSDPQHATHPVPFHEIDVPTVASGTTLVYKVQVAATHLFTGSTCTVYVNRSAAPGASNGSGTGISTITVLEVAA